MLRWLSFDSFKDRFTAIIPNRTAKQNGGLVWGPGNKGLKRCSPTRSSAHRTDKNEPFLCFRCVYMLEGGLSIVAHRLAGPLAYPTVACFCPMCYHWSQYAVKPR